MERDFDARRARGFAEGYHPTVVPPALLKKRSAIAFIVANVDKVKGLVDYLTSQELCQLRYSMRDLRVLSDQQLEQIRSLEIPQGQEGGAYTTEALRSVDIRQQLDAAVIELVPNTKAMSQKLMGISERYFEESDTIAFACKYGRVCDMPDALANRFCESADHLVDGFFCYRRNALFLAASGQFDKAVSACDKALGYYNEFVDESEDINGTRPKFGWAAQRGEVQMLRTVLSKPDHPERLTLLNEISRLCEHQLRMSRHMYQAMNKHLLVDVNNPQTLVRNATFYPLTRGRASFYSTFLELFNREALTPAEVCDNYRVQLGKCQGLGKKTTQALLSTMDRLSTRGFSEKELSSMGEVLTSCNRKVSAISLLTLIALAKSLQSVATLGGLGVKDIIKWVIDESFKYCTKDDDFTFLFVEAHRHATTLLVSLVNNGLEPLCEEDHDILVGLMSDIEQRVKQAAERTNARGTRCQDSVEDLVLELKRCEPFGRCGAEYASELLRIVNRIDTALGDHFKSLRLFTRNRYSNEVAFAIRKIATDVGSVNRDRYSLLEETDGQQKRRATDLKALFSGHPDKKVKAS